jgi:transcriptional regulator GlxA family with amidase domain
MSSRLDRITDWTQSAVRAGYSAARLARLCQVTPRQLERFFHEHHQCTPHHWLREQRMRRALELVIEGMSGKEVAVQLGYKNTPHFARDFKKFYGVTPGRYLGSLVAASPARFGPTIRPLPASGGFLSIIATAQHTCL